MPTVYSLAFAVLTTVVLVHVVSPLAQRVGLTAQPSYRKRHSGYVPLTGGVAMFGGFVAAVAVSGVAWADIAPLLAGSALLVLVGLLDDFRGLTAAARLAAQMVAALIMCLGGGVVLQDLGQLLPGTAPVQLGEWAIPFTVFATVGVINAMNMSDGMDGLGGGLALVALVSLSAIAWVAGRSGELHILLLLILVVGAFLSFNLRLPGRVRARVFMGNSGSMLLGLLFAWFAIRLSQGPERAMTPVTAVWLFALPLIDAVSMMLRRLWKGRSPFSADREHYHHVLVHAGYSVPEALGMVVAFAVVCALIGSGGLYLAVPESFLLYAFLGLTALYFWALMRAWRMLRFLRRPIERRETRRGRRYRSDRRTADVGSPTGVERRSRLERRVCADRRRSVIASRTADAAEDESEKVGVLQ